MPFSASFDMPQTKPTRIARSKCPVFVVGFPRSGTTLLYDMLLSSGGFAVYLTESHFFTTFVPRFGNLVKRKNRERLLAHWLSSDYFRLTGLAAADIEQQILENCASSGDFLRIVMDTMAQRQNVSRWAEKTPDHLLHLKEIKRSLPDALIIHIIRDGRDVALSVEKQNWVRPFPWDRKCNLLVCGTYWEWMVEVGRRMGATFAPDYMEVRFEDLIRQPQPTLARISEFIEHDLDYAHILRAGIGSLRRPNSSFQNGRDQFNPVSRWKTAFPPAQLASFEAMLGSALKNFGYALATPQSELRTSFDLWRLRAVYRSYFSLRLWAKTHNVPLTRCLVGRRDRDIMRWADVHEAGR